MNVINEFNLNLNLKYQLVKQIFVLILLIEFMTAFLNYIHQLDL